MLISFSVENYFSFKEPATISLVVSPALTEHVQSHTFAMDEDTDLLHSGIIYGANASGKSNFIMAMVFLKRMVLSSASPTFLDKGVSIQPFQPYLLDQNVDGKPTSFEIDFQCFYEGTLKPFHYEVSLTKDKVLYETLAYYPLGRPRLVFSRKGQDFLFGAAFKKEKMQANNTRDNVLLLSQAASQNSEISLAVIDWFLDFNIIDGMKDVGLTQFINSYWSEQDNQERLLKHLNIADPSIKGVGIKQDDLQFTRKSTHLRKNKEGREEKVIFDMDQESQGTQTMFNLAPFIDYALEKGLVLVIDELGSHIHPLLTQFIIELFHSERNKRNAQLIVTSHDLNLLNRSVFRRDQIWFTEKDKQNASHLYSLAEYKVRKDASFDKDYLAGKYGALPEVDPALLVKEL